ncbi:MAG TPA: hypothetical protein VHZ25_15610 [Acidobacteriaceae bacterium]|jgi:hypothetical protein|nr:hypothetical protein [Acidobacteriaceae bacterium]
MAAVPDFDGSSVLVALTVTLAAAAGAVNSPAELIDPPEADQVTALLKLPVPCTVALHCEVAPAVTVEGEQVTDTEEIIGSAAACTVIVAVPDFEVSSVLVALTVTLAAAAGAVKSPAELIDPPPETDQVTAVLKLPVPCTLAEHCDVAPGATVDGEHVGVTDEMAGEEVWGGAELF